MELCGCNGCLLRQSSRQTDWLNPEKSPEVVCDVSGLGERSRRVQILEVWLLWHTKNTKHFVAFYYHTNYNNLATGLKCESRFDRSWVPDTTQPRGPWTHHAARKPKNLSSASPERIVRLFGFNESYMSLRLFVSTLRDTLIVEASYWSKF